MSFTEQYRRTGCIGLFEDAGSGLILGCGRGSRSVSGFRSAHCRWTREGAQAGTHGSGRPALVVDRERIARLDAEEGTLRAEIAAEMGNFGGQRLPHSESLPTETAPERFVSLPKCTCSSP